MTEFFLNVVNMSISASWLVCAVLLLRLLLKKAPKWINVLLWGIVGLRLIMPFSFESIFSLIPSSETISKAPDSPRPHFESGVTIIDNQVNDYLGEHYFEGITRPAGHFADITTILAIVWIVGIVLLLTYTVISYSRVKNKIGTAVVLRDNIYQSESVVSPFVLGIIKPKIYLPFNMNEQDMQHVIAHEQAHIRRKDHLWKPFGFLLLTVYWFNPLMWLGYVLLCRDIELACDEKVVKEFDNLQKADYSQALLTCSVNRSLIAACPIAFGEVGVKERVKSVLNYKKPAFWVIIVAVITSVAVAVCFLTNPATKLNTNMASFIEEQIIEYHHGNYKYGEFYCTDFKVLETKKDKENTTVYMWVLYSEYDEVNGKIEDVSGAYTPTVITVKETDSSQYELVEYWEPGYGSCYAEDIRAKFPWYLHEKALDSIHYIKEQQANCDKKAQEYFSYLSNVGGAVSRDVLSYETTVSYHLEAYEVTPPEDIQAKYDNEEFVYQKLHYKATDGTWSCEGYTYKYRLEITGRLKNAAKNTTYIVLSNSKDITFEQTWKASGLSSLMSDYFEPEDAVIVGHKLFS